MIKQFTCKFCHKEFEKRTSQKREYTYCSGSCRSKDRYEGIDRKFFIRSFKCKICGMMFERTARFDQTIETCSPVCNGKLVTLKRGQTIRETITRECEFCKKEFTKKTRARGNAYRFCSRDCSAKFVGTKINGFENMLRRWTTKFGEDRAKEMAEETRQKWSKAAISKNTGRILSESTKRKIAESCTGIPNKLKGKTFEEFYGSERGKQLAQDHSEKLKKSFAEGKIQPTARSRSAPIFRGVKLRSLLEQYAIEFLEKRDGLIFGKDLIYEDRTIRVTWSDDKGQTHTYHPDLHDLRTNKVYEVKPERLISVRKDNEIKLTAARSQGLNIEFLTDKDIGFSWH